MMGFMEWVEFDRQRKEKEKKNVKSTCQGSPEVGAVHIQGKADRSNQEIPQQVVHYVPEPPQ